MVGSEDRISLEELVKKDSKDIDAKIIQLIRVNFMDFVKQLGNDEFNSLKLLEPAPSAEGDVPRFKYTPLSGTPNIIAPYISRRIELAPSVQI